MNELAMYIVGNDILDACNGVQQLDVTETDEWNN